ncbi:MAG: chemotaxis protein CheW [Acidobacteriota bacterium]
MEKTEVKDEILQLVSFKIGNEEFGVDILKVQEIIRMIEITQMPNSPEFVDGVINLRGRVIPVINLRKKLGLKRIEHDRNSRTIVVEICGKTIGFIVDSVSEVLRIPVNITEAPPSIAAGVNSDYITSIARLEDRLLILLDLEKTLLSEEKEQLSLASN